MKKIQKKIDPSIPASLAVGRIDNGRVDATIDAEINKHQEMDEIDAMIDTDVGTT